MRRHTSPYVWPPIPKTANVNQHSTQATRVPQTSIANEADAASVLDSLHSQDTASSGEEQALNLEETDQNASDCDDIDEYVYFPRPIKAAQEGIDGTYTQDQSRQRSDALLSAERSCLTVIKPESFSNPEEPKMQFPFMRLPLEVRNMVYEEILIMPSTIILGGNLMKGFQTIVRVKGLRTPTQASICNLFRASKTLYQETVSIYFRHNKFKVENVDRLVDLLTSIRPDHRRNICTLEVNYQGRAPSKAMKLLNECIGLRSLTLYIGWGTFSLIPSDIPWSNLRIRHDHLLRLIGVKNLLKLRGIEELLVTWPGDDIQPSWLDVIAAINRFTHAIEVVKTQHTQSQLKRQERKDYLRKAVFGKANVMTRSKRRIMMKQSLEV